MCHFFYFLLKSRKKRLLVWDYLYPSATSLRQCSNVLVTFVASVFNKKFDTSYILRQVIKHISLEI